MKCTNCESEISQTFSYAIKCNVCPACGKEIMDRDKMKLYNDLKECLEDVEFTMNGRAENIERVVTCIISKYNFDGTFSSKGASKPRPIRTHSPGETEITAGLDEYDDEPEELDPSFYEELDDVEFSDQSDEVDRLKGEYKKRRRQLAEIDARVKRSG